MATDPKFETDYGEDSQVTGYVLFNRLIQRANAVVQSNPNGRQSAPPGGTPADGDHYILESSPSGAWSGFAQHDIAFFFADQSVSGWLAISPQEGWRAYIRDEDRYVIFDGSKWVDLFTVSSSLGIRITDGGTGVPTQLAIDQASTTTRAGTAGYTTFTGYAALGTGGGVWVPQALPSGYTNTNPGWIRHFNGTAEIAVPYVSLA